MFSDCDFWQSRELYLAGVQGERGKNKLAKEKIETVKKQTVFLFVRNRCEPQVSSSNVQIPALKSTPSVLPGSNRWLFQSEKNKEKYPAKTVCSITSHLCLNRQEVRRQVWTELLRRCQQLLFVTFIRTSLKITHHSSSWWTTLLALCPTGFDRSFIKL